MHSPGRYGVCGKGDFKKKSEQTYVDGYKATAVTRPGGRVGVSVQYHEGLDNCVTPEDLMPNNAMVKIRDTQFAAPASTEKVLKLHSIL